MSLSPFNARARGTSHIDFKTATTGVAAKSMRNELSRLVSTIDDPATKKVHSLNMHLFYLTPTRMQAFDTEMQSFFFLFTRYLSERAQSIDLYVHILSVIIFSTHNHPVTGTVSNLQLRTRLFPMLTLQAQVIQQTSTNWPYSRSTVVSVLQWVRCS